MDTVGLECSYGVDLLYHTSRFGIEGYHAIIKIARDHLFLIDITITYGHRTFV